MKSYLKFMIILTSIIVIVLSIIISLSIIGRFDIKMINTLIENIKKSNVLKISVYVSSIVLSILCLISIMFSDILTKDIKGGIILPLKIGEVQIAPQTFENIILNISKKYAGFKTTKVVVKIKETGLTVDVFAYVLQDTVISDISDRLQKDIKESVLKQTTVSVEKVNIRVKGIYSLAVPKEEIRS